MIKHRSKMPYFSTSPPGTKCAECTAELGEGTLRCADCGGGVHVSCSGLPGLFLVRLAVTRATFACSECIRAKAGDKLREILSEIDSYRTPKSSRESTNDDESQEAADGDSSPQDIPSAPPESQMPSTQLLLAGDEPADLRDWVSLEQRGAESERNAGGGELPGTEGGESRRQTRPPGMRETKSRNTNQGATSKRTERAVCRYYKSGSCKFGPRGKNCKFAHPKKCYKFLRYGSDDKRGCRTSTCEYYHPPLCRGTEDGRGCRRENCRYYHRRAEEDKCLRNSKENKRNSVRKERDMEPDPRLLWEEKRLEKPVNYAAVVSGGATPNVERAEPPETFTGRNVMDGYRVHRSDFRLLQDQMTRMERLLAHLMSMGDLEGGSRQRHMEEYREPCF